MRYRDLKIVEMAAIGASPTPSSLQNYLDNINSILAGDERVLVVGKDEKSGWKFTADPEQTVTTADSEIRGKGTNLKGKKITKIYVKQLHKNEAIKGGTSVNMGDAAEAILGSALTAKFEMGGGSIGEKQLMKILNEAVEKGNYQTRAEYEDKTSKPDSCTFNLTLNDASLKGLKKWLKHDDPMSGNHKDFELAQEYPGNKGVPSLETGVKKVQELQKHVRNAVIYANQNERANTAVKIAADNKDHNEISVVSDGGDATQQSKTKVDLKIVYDNKSTTLLSLKAGNVRQFGQISGAEFGTITKFIDTMFDVRFDPELKEQFGFQDKQSENDVAYIEYNYKEPFKKLYAYTLEQMKKLIGGSNERQEYNFVQQLYKGINQHATLGEEGVTMVKLSPRAKVAYKELTFDKRLLDALKAYDFVVRPGSGRRAEGANHYIEVVGILKPKEAEAQTALTDEDIKELPQKDILVSLRSAVKAGSLRNTVEMGDLLDELADIEKMIAKNEKNPPEGKPEQPKQPAGTVTSKAGNQMKAGVDGKATVVPAEEPAPTG